MYPDALRSLRAAERQRSSRGRLLVPELCRALLTAGNGKLTETRCEIFLKGFQSVTVLQRRELLLFPAALQSALAEWAAGLCRKLLASSDPEALTDSMAALFTSLRRLGSMDLAGLLTACRAVSRGLNNYLAWLAPAACLFAAHFALWGYSPNPGAGLLTALLSLVGAAAGQVLKERGGKRKHTRQSRR